MQQLLRAVLVLSTLSGSASAATTAIAVASESVFDVDLTTGAYTQRSALVTPSPNFYCRDLARYDDATYFCAVLGDLYRLDLQVPNLLPVSTIPDTTTSGVTTKSDGNLWFLRQNAAGATFLLTLDPTTGAVLDQVALTLPPGTAEAISVSQGQVLVVGYDLPANLNWLALIDPLDGSPIETFTYVPLFGGGAIEDIDLTRVHDGTLWIAEWHATGIITAPNWSIFRRVTLDPFTVTLVWNGAGPTLHPPLVGIDRPLAPVVEIPTLDGRARTLLLLVLFGLGCVTIRRSRRAPDR